MKISFALTRRLGAFMLKSMSTAMERVSESQIVQILITLVTYAFYAVIIGVCLTPSLMIGFEAWRWLIASHTDASGVGALRAAWGGSSGPGLGRWLLFGVSLGGALYLYFIVGIFVMGLTIRLISRGIKPGVYADASPTMLRWLIYSGVYTLARGTILPMIPMTWFSTTFFRLIGCKIGKRVFLNSWKINDAYLMEIGDDVTVGGESDISCHIYDKGKLVLERVKIGSGTLIGARSYISPGVTIGRNCVIGLDAYIRRGKTIPDGSRITCLGGLPVREMARIEKLAARGFEAGRRGSRPAEPAPREPIAGA